MRFRACSAQRKDEPINNTQSQKRTSLMCDCRVGLRSSLESLRGIPSSLPMQETVCAFVRFDNIHNGIVYFTFYRERNCGYVRFANSSTRA